MWFWFLLVELSIFPGSLVDKERLLEYFWGQCECCPGSLLRPWISRLARFLCLGDHWYLIRLLQLHSFDFTFCEKHMKLMHAMNYKCAHGVIFSHTAPVLYSYPLLMVHLNGSLVCFYLVASLWCHYYLDCEACRSICTLVGCSAVVLINLWLGKTPVNVYMWLNFQRRWWYYWLWGVL